MDWLWGVWGVSHYLFCHEDRSIWRSGGRLICILEVEKAGCIEILNRISVLVRQCISLNIKCTTYTIMTANLFLNMCLCFVDVPWTAQQSSTIGFLQLSRDSVSLLSPSLVITTRWVSTMALCSPRIRYTRWVILLT